MESGKQSSLHLMGSGTGWRATLVGSGLYARDKFDGGDKDGAGSLRKFRQDTCLVVRCVTEGQVAQGTIDGMAERMWTVVVQRGGLYDLHCAQHQYHQQDELELPEL